MTILSFLLFYRLIFITIIFLVIIIHTFVSFIIGRIVYAGLILLIVVWFVAIFVHFIVFKLRNLHVAFLLYERLYKLREIEWFCNRALSKMVTQQTHKQTTIMIKLNPCLVIKCSIFCICKTPIYRDGTKSNGLLLKRCLNQQMQWMHVTWLLLIVSGWLYDQAI